MNGNRGEKLIRIPTARQGRALLSTTINTKRRQSKAPAEQMHQHTSPAWQNLQNMQSTVDCALLVASSTCQLPLTPMGLGRGDPRQARRTALQPPACRGAGGNRWHRVEHPCKAGVLVPVYKCGNCKREHDGPQHTAPKLAAAAQCQHQARQAAPRNTQGRAVG